MSVKLQPYIALDIETTGLLGESPSILQIAAIFDDGVTDPSKLDTFQCFIKPEFPIDGNFYALGMNAKLLHKMFTGEVETVKEEQAREMWSEWATALKAEHGKLSIAGKNAAGFDLPILEMNDFQVNTFSHRVIDVGSLYLPDFGKVPSLDEINKLIGRNPVNHDALCDAMDVVEAIRRKFK